MLETGSGDDQSTEICKRDETVAVFASIIEVKTYPEPVGRAPLILCKRSNFLQVKGRCAWKHS